jgi:prepilin-type processing-associated H-X9-DG protein
MHPPLAYEYRIFLHLNQMYLANTQAYVADNSGGEPQVPNTMGANDMLYNCADSAGAQLDGMPCATFQHNFATGWLSAAPRSRHVGGVNVAFLDGRIGFLPDSVDQYVMANLVSSNDGTAVDLGQVR